MGIGCNEFWDMNPRKLHPYILADRIRKEQMSYDAWIQGGYFCKALSVVIGNAFGKHHNETYFEEPIRITPLTEEEELAKAIRDQEIVKANLMAWSKNFEKKLNSEERSDNIDG